MNPPNLAILFLSPLAVTAMVLLGPALANVSGVSPRVAYENFSPPFHDAQTSQTGSTATYGSNDVDRQAISRGGNYSVMQNSSDSSNGTANQDTYGWFFGGAYSLKSMHTAIHVNTSGYGTGFAAIGVRCHYGGVASAHVDYSVELGLWDQRLLAWVGNTTHLIYSFNVSVLCSTPSMIATAGTNLAVGWSLGLNPSPSKVSQNDSLQIVTILHVHTQTHASWGGCHAYAFAWVAVTLLRMQGYHY